MTRAVALAALVLCGCASLPPAPARLANEPMPSPLRGARVGLGAVRVEAGEGWTGFGERTRDGAIASYRAALLARLGAELLGVGLELVPREAATAEAVLDVDAKVHVVPAVGANAWRSDVALTLSAGGRVVAATTARAEAADGLVLERLGTEDVHAGIAANLSVAFLPADARKRERDGPEPR